ncbi:MAG TPA: hypothetical protein VNZ52_13560 [Candidatus Thermoplasmatota archaeon]|nr:hypothetical protein [Candidatus Thermoplasmatota archaeon]
MQTTQDLAPHVKEITRALDNRVEPDIIEDELKRYLDYGVPLAQAKRDILRNHGGTPARQVAGEKKLADLQEGDQRVELNVKVLTVNPKEITVKGEQKTIWFGLLADATGKVPYTAWKDHGLQPNTSYAIQGAYVKKGFREGVEVNLGDYAQVQAVEDDFAPNEKGAATAPAAAGAASVGGQKNLADLQEGDQRVTVRVKVLTVNPKEITVKGEPKQIFYGLIADASAKVPYTAWKDYALQPGDSVELANVYVKKGFREGVEVNLGDYVTVTKLDFDVEAVAGAAPSAGGARGGDLPIKELRDGLTSVNVIGRILDLRERSITTQNGPRTLLEGELADESGKVAFTDWSGDQHRDLLKLDAVVSIRNAYTKSWRGVPNLNLGDSARIELLPANSLPPESELRKDTRYTLGELERVGGGSGIVVDGAVLEVKKGSGLIFRCKEPDCKRVLQNRMCRIHGKVEGVPDLRIKAVLDDGYGAVTFVVGREGTEKLLGKTLKDCQEMAKEAMTTDVVQEELETLLTGRTLSVHGNASKDDFGMQIIASDAHFPEARNVAAEAEALLAEIGGEF